MFNTFKLSLKKQKSNVEQWLYVIVFAVSICEKLKHMLYRFGSPDDYYEETTKAHTKFLVA